MNSNTAGDAKAKCVRASISFPPELYVQLERIAQDKKVSVAWVVRDAVEKYVAQKWPLLEL
ncbi:Ribbon-helix-helix protein, copG family [Burkholderia pseudomallei]|nr:Ribbon-helix-helix protein, copG family [Burkholderia pseudomallei]CAJ8379959.1 Ribbon-helix-helix protein, copG family [Burkholderia pseudomallei]CAJ9809142.1 Ribbon-helix-helix protein, copG family [Burkholderia pseudomallei]